MHLFTVWSTPFTPNHTTESDSSTQTIYHMACCAQQTVLQEAVISQLHYSNRYHQPALTNNPSQCNITKTHTFMVAKVKTHYRLRSKVN